MNQRKARVAAIYDGCDALSAIDQAERNLRVAYRALELAKGHTRVANGVNDIATSGEQRASA